MFFVDTDCNFKGFDLKQLVSEENQMSSSFALHCEQTIEWSTTVIGTRLSLNKPICQRTAAMATLVAKQTQTVVPAGSIPT